MNDSDSNKSPIEPIAIVGMACHYPKGITTSALYWEALVNGRDHNSEIPSDRWNHEDYYDPNPEVANKIHTKRGGFLTESLKHFDAAFFGLSESEVETMDPQHRLVLETIWEAFENAGIDPLSLSKSETSVYLGMSTSDFSTLLGDAAKKGEKINQYSITGNAISAAAGRVSYLLNLRGAAYTIDTACSSSLVGVHEACQKLRSHEVNLSVISGVNVILSPDTMISFSNVNMLSPDGTSHAFDEKANGFARGEGCGAIVLKRYSDAVAANDPILAVITGSAVNQDGKTPNLTAPDPSAQKKLVRKALHMAGLAPNDIDYIEAHGTGTKVGDGVELQALRKVFLDDRSSENPLLIGSAKINIAHQEAGSGLAGLIKMVLALQHEILPPHKIFSSTHALITDSDSKMALLDKPRSWKNREGHVRRAGVNSFGFSGTNAHVIIEEAPRRTPPLQKSEVKHPHVFTLSAKTPAALAEYAKKMHDHLSQQNVSEDVADICYTSNTGRSHFETRIGFAVNNKSELLEKLAQKTNDIFSSSLKNPKVVFMFTGQGSQYLKMGESLYKNIPIFKQIIDDCASILERLIDIPLTTLLFESEPEILNKTNYAQPALFAVEYALAMLWKSWGVQPAYVMGHSLGEIVAATVSGMMSLTDALNLVSERGRLMSSLPSQGGMLVVMANDITVEEKINVYKNKNDAQKVLSIAAVNSPEQTVVAGTREELEEFSALLKENHIPFKMFESVSTAFHSSFVEPILQKFYAVAQKIKYCKSSVGFVSSIDGEIINEVTADYWMKQMRAPVLFMKSLASLAKEKNVVYLEIGPQGILTRFVENYAAAAGGEIFVHASLQKKRDAYFCVIEVLRKLYENGVKINWQSFAARLLNKPKYYELPTYPFQRKRLWPEALDNIKKMNTTATVKAEHPLLGFRLPCVAHDQRRVFQNYFNISQSPDLAYLADHKIYGRIIFPALGFMEIMLAAGRIMSKELLGHFQSFYLKQMEVEAPLSFLPEEAVELQTIVEQSSGASSEEKYQTYHMTIYSRTYLEKRTHENEGWRKHAKGEVVFGVELKKNHEAVISLEEIKAQAIHKTDITLYQDLTKIGIFYGSAFQSVDLNDVWLNEKFAFARLAFLHSSLIPSNISAYSLHPGLIDGSMHLLSFKEMSEEEKNHVYLASRFENVEVYEPIPSPCYAKVVWKESAVSALRSGSVNFYNAEGRLVATIGNLQTRQASLESLIRMIFSQNSSAQFFYRSDWIEKSLILPKKNNYFERGVCLVFVQPSDKKMCESVCDTFEKEWGLKCVYVFPGEEFKIQNDNTIVIHSEKKEDYDGLLAQYGNSLRHVVHAWSIEPKHIRNTIDMKSAQQIIDAQSYGSRSILNLTQALNSAAQGEVAFWLMGSGIYEIDVSPLSLAHAPLKGMAQCFLNEFPQTDFTFIDSDPLNDQNPFEVLKHEMQARLEEDEIKQNKIVAYRGGKRYVPALLSHISLLGKNRALAFPSQDAYRLVESSNEDVRKDKFEHLAIEPLGLSSSIGDEEVEIAVIAVGLNFRDVLSASHHYPGDAGPLGGDCSGVVTRIGKEVKNFNVGDSVYGFSSGSLASHTRTHKNNIHLVPQNITLQSAATLPTAFLTVYYSLVMLGKIRKGHIVLIHTATGGVGLAAIQVAQQYGATIIATAGSKRKRQYLIEQGINPDHIFDSRSANYANDILEVTRGHGVDLVLNTLTGPGFIEETLNSCASSAAFIEISKRDIYSHQQIKEKRSDINYHVVAIDEMIFRNNPVIPEMLQIVTKNIEQGVYCPLPKVEFEITQSPQAFEWLRHARHIGKIVINTQKPKLLHKQFDEQGVYWITGGLGGIGVKLANWLIERGVKNLILTTRRDVSLNIHSPQIQQWEMQGIKIQVITLDVSDEQQVNALLDKLQKSHQSLKGIFHTAGILHDGVWHSQSWQTYLDVWKAKVNGAWNLHTATRMKNIVLDHFILFSSIATTLGSPAQSNYAAANAFLDSLAHYRKIQGLAGLSINWGTWAEVGMAAKHIEIHQKGGILGMCPELALQALGDAMMLKLSNLVISNLYLQWLTQALPALDSYFSYLIETPQKKVSQQKGEIISHLRSIDSKKCYEVLRNAIERIFMDRSQITDLEELRSQTLIELGVDSLSQMDIKNSLERITGIKNLLPFEDYLLPTQEVVNRVIVVVAKREGFDGMLKQALGYLPNTPIGKNKAILFPPKAPEVSSPESLNNDQESGNVREFK